MLYAVNHIDMCESVAVAGDYSTFRFPKFSMSQQSMILRNMVPTMVSKGRTLNASCYPIAKIAKDHLKVIQSLHLTIKVKKFEFRDFKKGIAYLLPPPLQSNITY